MRITEIRAHHVRIPLKKEIRHASHSRRETDSLVVGCRFEDGTLGWGEGLPREYVTGDSIDSTWESLADCNWSRSLGGDWNSIDSAVERLANESWIETPSGQRDCYGNPLRCAVELSVLDGLCRVLGRSLSVVIASVPESIAIRQSLPEIRYSTAITSMSPRKQWLSAWKMKLWRFRQCKVKVGAEGIDDASTLRRIRRIVGSEMDLRLDANEAWRVDELSARVEPLLEFNVTSLEQPVPHAQSDRLREVRGRLGVPLMLDESLCSVSDARRAIELGTCDLFNIRLSKCGGLIRALQIAALAHRAGLGYQLGCQVGETALLSAAGRHFACSVSGIRYLEGSYDKYLVRENLARQDITFGFGGVAPALTGPGLGIDLDPSALERVTRRFARWAVE